MHLISRLTLLPVFTLSAVLLTGCAGNAPRKPTSAEDKNGTTTLDDRCLEAESRGSIPPAGCPETTNSRRRTTRTGPVIDGDALPLPSLPSGGVLSGGNPLDRR